MKILHTADWHLGKRLEHFSRLEEQKRVMQELLAIADKEQVDLVLVAGDLFDNFNPSTEATELFYKSLKALSNNGKRPVVAIAGNHDSPDRIDAPDPLAKACGIILIGYPQAEVTPFELDDFALTKSAPGFIELQLKTVDFPVRIIHTPYANEIRLKEYLGEDDKELALNLSLQKKWNALADEFCDDKGVNLLISHLFMMKKGLPKPEEPEGEKPIMIGNADLIYSEIIPDSIQYTALGHLHNYQNIGTEEKPVVYSSSILSYSFSEAGQQKSVSIIEVVPDEKVKLKKIDLKNGRSLERQQFDEVDAAVAWLEANPNCLVELTLESDTFLKAEDRKRILQAHDGLIHLIPKLKKSDHQEEEQTMRIDVSKDRESLFVDYFKSKNKGQEPNQDLLDLLKEITN